MAGLACECGASFRYKSFVMSQKIITFATRFRYDINIISQ